jgi:enoyl-CoA hydratase
MPITTRSHDGILTVTLDDGAKNALDIDTFEGLIAAFDGADDDVDAIVVAGREGILTAGLNIKWMAAAGRGDIQRLLTTFGRAMIRIWTEPRPTVCAATGHAVAAGTMLAMACDHAVAAEGEFAWGLTETRIDFELPEFGILLARHNVGADHLEDLLLPGRRVDAATAVGVGFADELAPSDEVVDRATAVARELAELPARAYAGTKHRLRGDDAATVLGRLQDDITALTAHLPEG